MDDEQYSLTQHQLFIIARIVNTLDLEGFLSRIDDAEAIGPFVDPTLFIRGADRLAQVKDIALAAQHLQEVVRRTLHPDC